MKILANCCKCKKDFYLDKWRAIRAEKNNYNLFCNLECKSNYGIDRFWNNVNKKSKEECWELIKISVHSDYGHIKYKNKWYGSHRFSYILEYGEILDSKLAVCHKCDNPRCVNPNHLFLGTIKENNQDIFKKKKRNFVAKAKLLLTECLEYIPKEQIELIKRIKENI